MLYAYFFLYKTWWCKRVVRQIDIFSQTTGNDDVYHTDANVYETLY